MSYRLISSNDIAIKYPEVNDMPCIYADLPNGMDGEHYVLEQEPKWIPVSERLPEKYTYTLWCASSGYVRSDYFNGEYWEGAKKFCYDVIAWMPLPEPYKESDVVCTYQESGCGSCKHQTDCPY